MQIIVNHVTRMRAPRICVAGIDERTRRHIRPITPRSDPLTRELLRSQGGPFGPGAVVDIGALAAQGRPPEVEDHRFAASQARHVEDLADDAYLTALGKVARGSVVEAFGPALREVRPRKLAVPAGRGECSLAVVEVRCPRLHIDGWGKLRLDLDDGHVSARLPVTDARFYGAEDEIDSRMVSDVGRRLASGIRTYAMLGLARAIGDAEAGSVHWLQCNGVCLSDRAVGDIP